MNKIQTNHSQTQSHSRHTKHHTYALIEILLVLFASFVCSLCMHKSKLVGMDVVARIWAKPAQKQDSLCVNH